MPQADRSIVLEDVDERVCLIQEDGCETDPKLRWQYTYTALPVFMLGVESLDRSLALVEVARLSHLLEQRWDVPIENLLSKVRPVALLVHVLLTERLDGHVKLFGDSSHDAFVHHHSLR